MISLHNALLKTVDQFKDLVIPEQRRFELEVIAKRIVPLKESGLPLNFVFICTHNSRRSQISQVWAQTAAAYFGIPAMCFSGGSEKTVFDQRAVSALERAGFRNTSESGDPDRHHISFSPETEDILCFSKKYDAPQNPQKDFIALMTCSQADEHCPVITGAILRFTLPYEDPKAFDGSAQEATAYDACCIQIGTELWYLFSLLR